jgi:hypothetical protein
MNIDLNKFKVVVRQKDTIKKLTGTFDAETIDIAIGLARDHYATSLDTTEDNIEVLKAKITK